MFEGRWYSRDGRPAMKSATSLKGGITAECKSWLRVPCCDQGCDGGMGATGERCRGMEPAGMSVVNDNGFVVEMGGVACRRYGGSRDDGSEAAGASMRAAEKGDGVGGLMALAVGMTCKTRRGFG